MKQILPDHQYQNHGQAPCYPPLSDHEGCTALITNVNDMGNKGSILWQFKDSYTNLQALQR